MDSLLPSDARTRAADLFERYAEALLRWLLRKHPQTDLELRNDAVVSAILFLAEHPEKHNPERRPLDRFLGVLARRKLLTLLRSQQRRRVREEKKAVEAVTKAVAAAKSPLDVLADRELAGRFKEELAQQPEERLVLELWLLDAPFADYVEKLMLTPLSAAEQQRTVERHLARLRKRLQRCRDRLDRGDL